MNATDRQFNPMGAFKKLTSKRSHNATKVGFNTKAPLVGMFSSLNYENPGRLFEHYFNFCFLVYFRNCRKFCLFLGPADYAYDKTSELARCKGYAIPVSCRFPNLDKVSPGPTDYTVSLNFINYFTIFKVFFKNWVHNKRSYDSGIQWFLKNKICVFLDLTRSTSTGLYTISIFINFGLNVEFLFAMIFDL